MSISSYYMLLFVMLCTDDSTLLSLCLLSALLFASLCYALDTTINHKPRTSPRRRAAPMRWYNPFYLCYDPAIACFILLYIPCLSLLFIIYISIYYIYLIIYILIDCLLSCPFDCPCPADYDLASSLLDYLTMYCVYAYILIDWILSWSFIQ